MKIRFWGVRGSIPSPGPHTTRYGGNTSCIEVRGGKDNQELLIIDAGTGIRALGNNIIAEAASSKRNIDITIMLTHTHWDHIHGLPFFAPAYLSTAKIKIIGPVNLAGSLEDVIMGPIATPHFPVRLSDLRANISFHEIQEIAFSHGPFHISSQYMNHPILDLGYRIECDNRIVSTCYDTEPYRNVFRDIENSEEIDEEAMKEGDRYVSEMNEKLRDHIRNADLCIYDSQYLKEEYEANKKGWGHSHVDHALDSAMDAGVRNLAIFHHDPARTDEQLDAIGIYAKKKARDDSSESKKMGVFVARERMEIFL